MNTLTPEAIRAAIKSGSKSYRLPVLHYCMGCGYEVVAVVMRRGKWSVDSGWLDAEWSECCGARVASVNA